MYNVHSSVYWKLPSKKHSRTLLRSLVSVFKWQIPTNAIKTANIYIHTAGIIVLNCFSCMFVFVCVCVACDAMKFSLTAHLSLFVFSAFLGFYDSFTHTFFRPFSLNISSHHFVLVECHVFSDVMEIEQCNLHPSPSLIPINFWNGTVRMTDCFSMWTDF